MYKYAIGVPHVGPVPGPFLDSMMGLTKPRDGFYWLRAGGMPVDMARNVLVKQFLEGDAEWLLQVDCDMTFAPASLERLASRGEELIRPKSLFPTVDLHLGQLAHGRGGGAVQTAAALVEGCGNVEIRIP